MQLYQLPGAFGALLHDIEANDGELTDDQLAALDGLQATLAERVDAVGAIVAQLTHEAAALDAEALRLSRRRLARIKAANRLKALLHDAVAAAGGGQVKGERFVAWVQRNGTPSCRYVGPPDAIPDGYRLTVTHTEPDRERAVESWRETGEAPAGFVVEVGTHLRLK